MNHKENHISLKFMDWTFNIKTQSLVVISGVIIFLGGALTNIKAILWIGVGILSIYCAIAIIFELIERYIENMNESAKIIKKEKQETISQIDQINKAHLELIEDKHKNAIIEITRMVGGNTSPSTASEVSQEDKVGDWSPEERPFES